MSRQRSLSVNDAEFARFNALKVRLAISRGNRIPKVVNMVSAMISVAENHYDELLRELANEPESES